MIDIVWFRYLAAFALVCLTACQTTPKNAPSLPGDLASQFGTCGLDDGAATLQVFEQGALAGSAEIEWTSKGRDHWDLEILSNVGTTLASVSRHGLFLEIAGSYSRRLPQLSISVENDLLVEDHFSGLKAHEVLCLLGGRLPYDWVQGLQGIDRQKYRTTLYIQDKNRHIKTLVETPPETDPRICTEIEWYSYWIFSHSLRWCMGEKGQRSGSLAGYRGFSLKWVRFE